MGSMTNIVEFVEKTFGIKLLEYQKAILREYQKGRKLYIVMPPYHGRTCFNTLYDTVMSVYGKGEN